MSQFVTDDILLEEAKEEMLRYSEGYEQNGLVLGNTYTDSISAIYELLVKIYGKPYLKSHGIEMERCQE